MLSKLLECKEQGFKYLIVRDDEVETKLLRVNVTKDDSSTQVITMKIALIEKCDFMVYDLDEFIRGVQEHKDEFKDVAIEFMN